MTRKKDRICQHHGAENMKCLTNLSYTPGSSSQL